MRNRYYDAAMGRFMQRDPIGWDAGDVNWYRYCGNTPVYHFDPRGEVAPVAWVLCSEALPYLIAAAEAAGIGFMAFLELTAQGHLKAMIDEKLNQNPKNPCDDPEYANDPAHVNECNPKEVEGSSKTKTLKEKYDGADVQKNAIDTPAGFPYGF